MPDYIFQQMTSPHIPRVYNPKSPRQTPPLPPQSHIPPVFPLQNIIKRTAEFRHSQVLLFKLQESSSLALAFMLRVVKLNVTTCHLCILASVVLCSLALLL